MMKQTETLALPISIIIPTYSEEATLPRLLESIKKQIVGADEVIVADAFSPDKTREVAKKYGCIVVDGGKIALGRNNGAKVAKNEYLLFIDADTTLPTQSTLVEAFAEFLKSESDIASVGFKAERKGSTPFGLATSTVLFSSLNVIRKFQKLTQHPLVEGGAFVLVKKSVFEHIGGFDQNFGVGEDSEFFRRASKFGYKYNHMPQIVMTSTRRYNDPKKASKTFVSFMLQGLFLAAGVYVGSTIFQKLVKGYGPAGGGVGKDQSDK